MSPERATPNPDAVTFAQIRRVHFVGIGGIGMSGVAELLVNLGYDVSGSDLKPSALTRRLEALGVAVYEGHSPHNVGDVDVLVFSSAVRPDNPEIVEASRRKIPAVPRAEMLGELMRLRVAIAVAGSHGKTTTTSMIAFALEQVGLDPTAVIGGRLSAFGSNARLGRGQFMVAEADESDRSFLMLWPSIAVITNVDDEHTESYGSLEQMQVAFAEFANRVPFYGRVVACADDPGVATVLPRVRRRLVTYGLDPAADVVGSGVSLGTFGGRCTVYRRRDASMEPLGMLELAAPGRHNLQNALAAVAVALGIGVEFARVAEALRGFLGAERRFERHGEADGVLVLDDYGHHPTEIAAVLAAARVTLARRLVVAFQPHRYTRTARLMQTFGSSLRDADEIVLTDIYPAGEPPIQGVTIEGFADVVRHQSGRPVTLAKRLDEVVPALLSTVRPGDAIITLGAGSIGALPQRLVEALREREARRR